MSPDDRYDVSRLTEAQFEPGSDGLVLKNLLGITSPAEMDIAEANALVVAVDRLVRMYDEEHVLRQAISASFTVCGWEAFMPGLGSIVR